MTKPTESERLYVVETKLDTVLKTVEQTNATVAEIAGTLGKYATQDDLRSAVAERDSLIKELRKSIALMGKKHQLNVWLAGLASMALGVFVTILLHKAFGR